MVRNNYTLAAHGSNDTLIWGMKNAERVGRLARKSGISTEPAGGDRVIWTDLAYIFDPVWLTHVLDQPGIVIVDRGRPILANVESRHAGLLDDGALVPGASIIDIADKPALYNKQLRKLENPFFEPLTAASAASIERKSYYGAYKGVTDLLTKYLWPELALMLTRIAARSGMAPNMVTSIGAIFCLLALYFFWQGQYWLGVGTGFVFMVLDTVDGKLARCTITSSAWGNIFDHGIDLVHPPFWWLAWAHGLVHWGLGLPDRLYWWVIGTIFAGYILQRLVEGWFIRRHELDVHTWRPIDSQFRLITARRKPNMVLLFVSLLLGRPDWGVIAIAIWTLLSLLFHIAQLFQAEARVRQGGKVTSWMEEQSA